MAGPASAPAAAEPLGPPVPFAADTVVKMAAELASKPFKEPEATPLPGLFSNLTFEQYAAIRRVPGTAIWSDQKLGFSLEPLHRGFVYTTPIGINIVENGAAQKVIYDAANFDFGPSKPPPVLGDLGFSGLRILTASDQGFEDVAIFQGATFYRARGHAQPFGLTARGLSIRTGDDPGEEFPLFREFWIEKPNPAANTLTMQALLDSPSVTGAFRFTLRPAETTIIDTEMTLIARAAVDKLGFGAMAAAYLFSPLDHRRPDDVRAAVYEFDGPADSHRRRRVAVAPGLQSGNLADLGLFRRQPARLRSFATQSFLRRVLRRRDALGTEALIVDRADWRLGRRATSVCWKSQPPQRPTRTSSCNGGQKPVWPPPRRSRPRSANSGAGPRRRSRRSRLAYRHDAARSATASASRSRWPETSSLIRAKAAAATADVRPSPGKIVSVRLFPYKDRRSVRVVFDLDPGSETYSELRLTLRVDNQTASETWLYRWTA